MKPTIDKDELPYIKDIETVIALEQPKHYHYLPYILLALLVVFILWAKFSVVEEITLADGKVIPSGQVKLIQNLEGGILKKLLVKEGQSVKAGSVLAELDNTQFQSEHRQEQLKVLSLMANLDRLNAESIGKNSVDYRAALKAQGQLMKEQNAVFLSRKKALAKKIAIVKKSLDFSEKELKIARPLVADGMMSKLELYQLERKANDLKGAQFDERRKYQQDAIAEKNKKQAELAVAKERLSSLKFKLKRTTILSPVNGVVKDIHVTTLGGIIKPGEDIMEIVPIDDGLLIEAKVSPKDIAFIAPDLPVKIKVTAYDYTVYGGLEGKIVYVSADSHEVEDKSFYDVKIHTNKSTIETKEKVLKIIPGMVVSAHIITGERSILSYLLKPLLRAKNNALRER